MFFTGPGSLLGSVRTAFIAAVLTVSAAIGGSAHPADAGRLARSPLRTVRLTVEVNGDLLVHGPVWQRALQYGHGRYDFSPMLREISPYLKRSDLAICHVETPMTPRAPQGYPVFNTPTQLARAIRIAGWRVCDTASNHSVDQGQYGIDQTGLALDRAGVLHTGSFSSPAAQNRTLMISVKGVRIAFLAYTEMTNGIPLPASVVGQPRGRRLGAAGGAAGPPAGGAGGDRELPLGTGVPVGAERVPARHGRRWPPIRTSPRSSGSTSMSSSRSSV